MPMPTKCRRRKIGSTRFHVNIDVHVFSRNPEESACEGLGVIRNMSMRGAMIETHLVVMPGERMTLEVSLPKEADLVTINDVVIRWREGGRVGVEFVKLDSNTSQRLMLFLAGLHRSMRLPCAATEEPMVPGQS